MIEQRVVIFPSVLIAVALGLAHTSAVAVLWLLPIAVLAKAVVTIVVAASLVFFMARDAALHAADSIVALEIRQGGELACRTRRGEWVDCELLGSSYVSPHLTVVNLRPRAWRRSRAVLLVPDNVDARDFRRLRMWLRWRSAEGRDGAAIMDP